MREAGVPTVVTVAADAALTDPLVRTADERPDDVLYRRQDGRQWRPVTAATFAAEVRALARGLVAAGVGPGDRVGLMSRTRYEWTLVDYAVWTAGAVSVPIYETSSAEQVSWILADSGAVAVVVETAAHRALVEQASGSLPALREVWEIDAGALAELAARGGEVAEDILAARRAAVRADSLATIVYTSGTTGRPKGCALTHGNFLFYARTVGELLPELLRRGGSTLLFLPLAHSLARALQVGGLVEGVEVGHVPDARSLAEDMPVFKPTFLVAVPRVFEKVYNSARATAHDRGMLGRLLFDAAERTAVARSRAMDGGRADPLLLLRHRLFDRLVYARLRAALGGRLRYAVSGGAPLGERLGHFFRGVGLTVIEGYGLTESCAAGTVNPPLAPRIGTVGRPLPGTRVRLADDGEVLLAGPHVFAGYWNNEAATAEVLRDGWLLTGDLGELDDDGYLRIVGRKKEIIITAGGKNVSPAVLEDRLRAHPLVSQCIVVGDDRPYVAALVTLDAEMLPAWKARLGKPAGAGVDELREDPDLLRELDAAVGHANAAVSQAEAIRRYRVLAVDFTESGGHLTPTLKLRRAVVHKEFAQEIEVLYRR